MVDLSKKAFIPKYQIRVQSHEFGWQVAYVCAYLGNAEFHFRKWVGHAAHDEAEVPILAVKLMKRVDGVHDCLEVKMSWRKADD